MQIVIDLPEYTLASARSGSTSFEQMDIILESIRNGIVIPDNASNSDVLKELFPDLIAGDISHLLEIDDYDRQTLEKEWLNAPYKRGDIDGNID